MVLNKSRQKSFTSIIAHRIVCFDMRSRYLENATARKLNFFIHHRIASEVFSMKCQVTCEKCLVSQSCLRGFRQFNIVLFNQFFSTSHMKVEDFFYSCQLQVNFIQIIEFLGKYSKKVTEVAEFRYC